MAGDLRTMASNLRKRADVIPVQANELKKKVVRTIVNDLAHVTPVDTTEAISNWQLGIGTRPESEIAPHFPGKHGSTFAASSSETIAIAERELTAAKPGQPVYTSNVLRYIGFLNDGSSAQEPAGFVERAVLLGRKITSSFKFFK